MKDHTVKATRLFNDAVEGKERKAGDTFECTEERYQVLKEHNAVELVYKGEPAVVVPIPNANPEDVKVVELRETLAEQVAKDMAIKEPKKKTSRAKKINKK